MTKKSTKVFWTVVLISTILSVNLWSCKSMGTATSKLKQTISFQNLPKDIIKDIGQVPTTISVPTPILSSPTPSNAPDVHPPLEQPGFPSVDPSSNFSISIIYPTNNATLSGSVTLKARTNITENVKVGFYYKKNGIETLIKNTYQPYEIEWNTFSVFNDEYYLSAKANGIISEPVKVEVYNDTTYCSCCATEEIVSSKNPVEGGGYQTNLSIDPKCSAIAEWTVTYNDANIGSLTTNTGNITVWTAPTDAEAALLGITAPYTVNIKAIVGDVTRTKDINVHFGTGEIVSSENPVEGGGHLTVLSLNSIFPITWTVTYNGSNIGSLTTNTGSPTVWTAPTDAEAALLGITAPYTINVKANVEDVTRTKNINVNFGNEIVGSINGNY